MLKLHCLFYPKAQERMIKHGYIKGLKEIAQKMNGSIKEYRLLKQTSNLLNPSGVLIISKNYEKQISKNNNKFNTHSINWRCPKTKSDLLEFGDAYYSKESSFVYPILKGIPLLRKENGFFASKYENE